MTLGKYALFWEFMSYIKERWVISACYNSEKFAKRISRCSRYSPNESKAFICVDDIISQPNRQAVCLHKHIAYCENFVFAWLVISRKKRLETFVSSHNYLNIMAPQVGFEPTTSRLTADCSTVELLRNDKYYYSDFFYFVKTLGNFRDKFYVNHVLY